MGGAWSLSTATSLGSEEVQTYRQFNEALLLLPLAMMWVEDKHETLRMPCTGSASSALSSTAWPVSSPPCPDPELQSCSPPPPDCVCRLPLNLFYSQSLPPPPQQSCFSQQPGFWCSNAETEKQNVLDGDVFETLCEKMLREFSDEPMSVQDRPLERGANRNVGSVPLTARPEGVFAPSFPGLGGECCAWGNRDKSCFRASNLRKRERGVEKSLSYLSMNLLCPNTLRLCYSQRLLELLIRENSTK
ncbi:hypothetical protein AOLI_G00328540 [Acnodon oligacanthus]